MRKVLLFPLLWVVLVVSAHAEADSNSVDKSSGAMSAAVGKVTPAVRNWYAGVAVGNSELIGFDPKALDNYYLSLGYRIDGTSGSYSSSSEQGVYVGYKLQDYMDMELGFLRNTGWGEDYTKFSDYIGTKRYLSQRIKCEEFYLTALFRPFIRGLYFKLGGHKSVLYSTVTLNNTIVDVNAIGVGDRVLAHGNYHGYGMLFGLGFDLRLPKGNTIRLEIARHNNLGGTSYKKDSMLIGYNKSF